jgi:hypothetical protein
MHISKRMRLASTSSSKRKISDKRVVAPLVATMTGPGRDAFFSLPMPSCIRDIAFHLEDRRGNHDIVSESAIEHVLIVINILREVNGGLAQPCHSHLTPSQLPS